jgi:hypothetical protein
MWMRVPPPSLPRKGLLWLCERLKGNMRRELRNEKYPYNCTDFASPNLRIYTLLLPLVIWYIVSYGEKTTERPTDDVGPSGDCLPHVEFRNPVVSEGVD